MKIGQTMKAPTPSPEPAPELQVDVGGEEPLEVTGAPISLETTSQEDLKIEPQAGAVDIDVAVGQGALAAEKPTVKGGLLLRGAIAHNAVAVEKTKQDLAMSQNQWRFYCGVGEEARITFVDGDLDQDGALAIPYWYEHRLMVGRLTEIVCYETNQELGPCPVCQAGHKTQLVGGLTVINHTPYTVKSGQNAGKILKNRRQMFVAPRTALETMQILASKRGGLAGHCFDVSRKENKDPRVGSVFDYVGALTPEQKAGFGDDWKPFNWDEEITLLAVEEMTKLGNIAVPYGGTKNEQGSGGTANLNEIEI